MEKVILTQVSMEEFRQIIREELKTVLLEFMQPGNGGSPLEEIMTIDVAAKFLSLSKSRIYKLTSGREIPHSKKGKRLYFKRSELIEWISKGKQMTMEDIDREAEKYLRRNKRY
jgi:excisionase family DNA binding protein